MLLPTVMRRPLAYDRLISLLQTGAGSSELVELLGQLVAIDSVNPSLVPGGAGEAAIARFVADWLERAGLEVSVEEAAPGRPNVIGIARGSGGGRTLLLNAHTDTVGVAGMERPHEPRRGERVPLRTRRVRHEGRSRGLDAGRSLGAGTGR